MVELELELIWNRERKLTPWMLWELKLMLQMLLELEEEVVEEFHSMVLDSLGLCCLGLDSLEPDCLRLDSLGCLELGSLELYSLELGSPELDSLELEHEALEALEVLLLGSVVQLLSHCVRRLDTIVQVWDWPGLAWKIANGRRLSLWVVQWRLGLRG